MDSNHFLKSFFLFFIVNIILSCCRYYLFLMPIIMFFTRYCKTLSLWNTHSLINTYIQEITLHIHLLNYPITLKYQCQNQFYSINSIYRFKCLIIINVFLLSVTFGYQCSFIFINYPIKFIPFLYTHLVPVIPLPWGNWIKPHLSFLSIVSI